jgi:hypothetical protein
MSPDGQIFLLCLNNWVVIRFFPELSVLADLKDLKRATLKKATTGWWHNLSRLYRT